MFANQCKSCAYRQKRLGNMGRHKLEPCDLNIESEEEWGNLKSYPGLLLLDIYTKWAGPCEIMKPLIMKTKTQVFS